MDCRVWIVAFLHVVVSARYNHGLVELVRNEALRDDLPEGNATEDDSSPCRGLNGIDCRDKEDICDWKFDKEGEMACLDKPGKAIPRNRRGHSNAKTPDQDAMASSTSPSRPSKSATSSSDADSICEGLKIWECEEFIGWCEWQSGSCLPAQDIEVPRLSTHEFVDDNEVPSGGNDQLQQDGAARKSTTTTTTSTTIRETEKTTTTSTAATTTTTTTTIATTTITTTTATTTTTTIATTMTATTSTTTTTTSVTNNREEPKAIDGEGAAQSVSGKRHESGSHVDCANLQRRPCKASPGVCMWWPSGFDGMPPCIPVPAASV